MEIKMSKSRPKIPESIKRQVRQNSFFGCVICGMPFYEYEHIEEYSVVQEHTVDNIILLCPNHHSSKTTHKLSKERLIHGQKKPYNSQKPNTTPYKIEPSKKIDVNLGTNSCLGWDHAKYNEHHVIWINGQSFFTLHSDDGWLSTSLRITDQNGVILLNVIQGELVVSTNIFDYTYEGNNIKIRDNSDKRIILDIRIADNKVEIHQALFLHEGCDGFIIQQGMLYTICDKNMRGMSMGSSCYYNQNGAWGVLNTRKYPEITNPGGFGFFTS
jgi:HNH endonuclease